MWDGGFSLPSNNWFGPLPRNNKNALLTGHALLRHDERLTVLLIPMWLARWMNHLSSDDKYVG